MNNEKIKELAQKYAEYRAEPFDDAHDEIALEYFKDTTAFLRWLSQTHCIVEKSKVLEEYNYYKNSWNETELTETIIESLEDIFGSELFNDKEK